MMREMAFISYYFHWGEDEVMKLEHQARRRWCEEISSINKDLSPSEKSGQSKSIVDIKI